MRGTLKELALLTGGVAVGIALFFISTFHVDFQGLGYTSWGYPLVWHSFVKVGGITIFGVYLGAVNWLAFGEDLMFWLALSMAVVEGTSHIAVPYLKRKLEVQRSRQTTGSTQAMGPIQTPDAAA